MAGKLNESNANHENANHENAINAVTSIHFYLTLRPGTSVL
jgi:hypothetical protein